MVAWTWRYGDNGFCADAVVETEVLVFWFSIRLICYTDNPSGEMSCVMGFVWSCKETRYEKKNDETPMNCILYMYMYGNSGWALLWHRCWYCQLLKRSLDAIYICMTTKNYYTPHEPNNHQSLEGHHRSISNTLIEWAWKTTQLRMGWCAKLCRSKMAKRLAWITTEIGLDVFWDSNYIFRFFFLHILISGNCILIFTPIYIFKAIIILAIITKNVYTSYFYSFYGFHEFLAWMLWIMY